VPLIFMLIIATVTIQSLTARPLAQLLKVAEPSSFGFLILGANPIARKIGVALKNLEVPVTLTDTNYENVKLARMENLPVYFGNPVSEHASTHLDLTGIGNLLVVSPYKHMNTLATYHFLDWFGDTNVFTLADEAQEQNARLRTAEKIHMTRGLFNGLSYAKMASLAAKHYIIKTTQLSEEFTFKDFQKKYERQACVLFVLDSRDRISPVKDIESLKPEREWTLVSLVPPQPNKEKKEKPDRA
jgi:hypothetical protein